MPFRTGGISKFDNFVIVGGMANNVLKYKGYSIGKSIKENDCNQIVEEIFELSKKEKMPHKKRCHESYILEV